MNRMRGRRGLGAPFALPAGSAALLVVGAIAAGMNGRLPATGGLAAVAVVVTGVSLVAEPVAGQAAVAIAACCLLGAGFGQLVRQFGSSFTLWIVDMRGDREPGSSAWAGIRGRRQLAGVLLAAGLPLLTVALVTSRNRLSLADDLLIYLVAVVAIAVVGGFWPAVLAAIMSSLLLNWYFTPPLHTLSIAEPRSLLALLLFVTVAVTVSSVVHLSARRAVQAARSADEAGSLATSDFTVDLAAKRVRRGECDIRLTPTEWRAWWRRSCSWACGTPGPRC